MEDLIQNSISVELFGKKREIKFAVRNFAAARLRFGVDEQALIDGITSGDTEKIVQLIWAGTLVFEDFDPKDPIKIKEEIDLEKLYEINLMDIKQISDRVIEALIQSLPQEKSSKKKTSWLKKMLKKVSQ